MDKLSGFTKDELEQYVDLGLYNDQQIIDLHAELIDAKTGTMELDMVAGVVKRGDVELMTVQELLFLLGSARKYSESFPFEEAHIFMQELRETVGTGFTKTQMDEILKDMGRLQ